MQPADPNHTPKQPAPPRARFATIQSKLGRQGGSDVALRRYRYEIVSILEALDTLIRDMRGIRTRGRPGDVDMD